MPVEKTLCYFENLFTRKLLVRKKRIMVEFKQFLFITCIVLDIICIGLITSSKLEDLEKNNDKGYRRTGKFIVIVFVFATSYIVSYLL